MSKRSESEGAFLGLSESIINALDSVARALFWLGLGAMVASSGFLVYSFLAGGSGTEAQVLSNVKTFGTPALVGGLVAALVAAWLYWGEEILGPVTLFVGAAFVFSPFYLPMATQTPPPAADKILAALTAVGYAVGSVGILMVVGDLIGRAKVRVRHGIRSEQLKLGKGIKEEHDRRNVFLGKCWQLPYCRKFVREKCPIYHARRTCWKERVGCMCEESVIRNAMEGKVIPKDIVAAAAFIPKNNRLTPDQKRARCQSCVIFNEHLKHKYKAAVPLAAAACIGLYLGFRGPMGQSVAGFLQGANAKIAQTTFTEGNAAKPLDLNFGNIAIQEFIVAGFCFILFAYLIRTIEHVIFKLKV